MSGQNTKTTMTLNCETTENISVIKMDDGIEKLNQHDSLIQLDKFKERLSGISDSVTQIIQQVELISNPSNSEDDDEKAKMILLTELFNEVHHMCAEIRQITSQIRSIRNTEMKNDDQSGANDAEVEINRVLKQLSHLKSELHEKISKFIDLRENNEKINEATKICLQESSTRSEDVTEISIPSDRSNNHCSTDGAQLEFISEYIETMVKNIQEIYNTLEAIPNSYTDQGELKDQIRDLKVLERHLKRNEPLIKEVEFWLYHDFSKSSSRKGASIDALNNQFEKLCDVMKKTQVLQQLKSNKLSEILEQCSIKESRNKKARKSSSSSSGCEQKGENTENELLRYNQFCKREKKELHKDIEKAANTIENIYMILEEINHAIDDNRYISVTNDALISQQGYIFKNKQEIMNNHKNDFDWLLSFSDAIKLCKTDVPDHIFFEIHDLNTQWNSTKDRIDNAVDNLSKVRKYWILFEYYTVRVILWNKAFVLSHDKKSVKEWKNEANAIKGKIKRVKKIMTSLSEFVGEFSKKLIYKLWDDTEKEFTSLTEQL